jgi:hypothetical protein
MGCHLGKRTSTDAPLAERIGIFPITQLSAETARSGCVPGAAVFMALNPCASSAGISDNDD